MDNKNGSEFGAKERVSILLVLYESLRWDILVRTGGMFTLIAGATAAVLVLIPSAFEMRSEIILLSVLGILFAWLFYGIHRDIEKAAAKLRYLEDTINGLVGEELLDWEKHSGGSVTSYIGPGKPL